MKSKTTNCFKKIMCNVAKCERQRLYFLCVLTMPTIVVLLFVTVYSTHNTIARFRYKMSTSQINEIKTEENQNMATIKQIAINIAEETYKGTLGLGIGSLGLAFLLTHKTKLTQIPNRLRDTQRYISN